MCVRKCMTVSTIFALPVVALLWLLAAVAAHACRMKVFFSLPVVELRALS